MGRRRYTWASVLVAGLMVVGLAPSPAGAAETSSTDPAGDVTGEDGGPVTEPRADILGVTLDNRPGAVEVRIQVDEVVPFDDPLWDELFGVFVGSVLQAPGSDTGFVWNVFKFDGMPLAFLQPFEAASGDTLGHACLTDVAVDTTTSSYVFSDAGDCARGLPRSLAAGAFAYVGDGFDSLPDDPEIDDLSTVVETAEAAASAAVARLAGTDRIRTAVALSGDRFGDGEAFAAVVAAAHTFPDALAGGPLAYAAGGPLLLTGSSNLDPAVAIELERALPPGSTVFVLGGTAALSDEIVLDLGAAGFDAQRVAGPDRFATAVAIAEEVEAIFGFTSMALIADGRTFTDALIAGAASAAFEGGFVLLTDGATMPAATRSFLDSHDDTERVAIGANAGTAAAGARKITAATPSELSVAVSDELAPVHGAVAIASQATFPDALAGGIHIGSLGGPLLLTDPASLSPSVDQLLRGRADSLREVVIYGGTAAVSPAVETAVRNAVAG